jgi:hypothetical protein
MMFIKRSMIKKVLKSSLIEIGKSLISKFDLIENGKSLISQLTINPTDELTCENFFACPRFFSPFFQGFQGDGVPTL